MNIQALNFSGDRNFQQLTSFSFADEINMNLLMRQQLSLSVIKAGQVIFSHQDLLRQVLLQAAPTNDPATGHDGASTDSTDPQAPPTLLLHKLMTKAVYPSPIKAIYGEDDLLVRIISSHHMFCRETTTLISIVICYRRRQL